MLAAGLLLLGWSLAGFVQAHTVFTTLFVDGVNQGDGVSVRMNMDPSHTVDFIKNITSDDMACGVDGQIAVNRISPTKAGSTLTFEYRVWADGSHPQEPAIDISHKGPCTVYMKKVEDPLANGTAAGDGWFKIFDESYDENEEEWCTIKMSNNNGRLSAVIPEDIAPGYYLVRPELLALHQAAESPPVPQFYIGCAQIFVQSNGTAKPPTITIPENYVNLSMSAMRYNIYATPLSLPYPMYGPPVYKSHPSSSSPKKANKHSSTTSSLTQTLGLQPNNCIAINGNWCGIELSPYSTETGCWNASTACWKQCKTCYVEAQPTGDQGCRAWETYCDKVDQGCEDGEYEGPPSMGG